MTDDKKVIMLESIIDDRDATIEELTNLIELTSVDSLVEHQKDFDEAIKELYAVRDEYLLRLKELKEMKQRYTEEFEKLFSLFKK